jgi:hypothetical protein
MRALSVRVAAALRAWRKARERGPACASALIVRGAEARRSLRARKRMPERTCWQDISEKRADASAPRADEHTTRISAATGG